MSNEFSIFTTASACVAFIDQQMNGQPIATQRLPVAMETLDEPLYVNAKQYHRIIKRRQARAKLEAEGKIPKARKVSFCGLFIFKAKKFFQWSKRLLDAALLNFYERDISYIMLLFLKGLVIYVIN